MPTPEENRVDKANPETDVMANVVERLKKSKAAEMQDVEERGRDWARHSATRRQLVELAEAENDEVILRVISSEDFFDLFGSSAEPDSDLVNAFAGGAVEIWDEVAHRL